MAFQVLKARVSCTERGQVTTFDAVRIFKNMEGQFKRVACTVALVFTVMFGRTAHAATDIVIVTHPVSQQVELLQDVALSVVATGTGPLRYQWQKGISNIANATNDTLVLSGIQLLSLGNYRCKVLNDDGHVFSSNANISLRLLPPVLKDMFEASEVSSAITDSILDLNIGGASSQPGEPLHAGKPGGHSKWITWRAPANGIVTFNTAGSLFDTVLAVYTGSSLTNLQEVAANDDAGGGLTSEVMFNAVAGTDYHIAVDGFGGLIGACTLNWTLQINERMPAILSITGNKTVGRGEALTLSVNLDTPLATIQWYLNGNPIDGAQSSVLHIGSAQPENVGDYYVRVTLLGISVLSATTSVQINDTDGTVDRSAAAYNKIGEAAAAQPKSGTAAKSTTTKSTTTTTKPSSDSKYATSSGATYKSASTDSRGYTTTQIFNTSGATKEPGEPNACGETGGASMWFAYKAPTNGLIAIDTQGSTFDTVMAVYVGPGTSYSTLTNVECNNNVDASNTWSRVLFTATAGTTYYIQVDGVNGAKGTVNLTITLGSAPDVLDQPESQPALPGAAVTLHVSFAGAPAPKLQWYFNTNIVYGATNNNLVITNFDESKSGEYFAVLENKLGSATSETAAIVVAVAPKCAQLTFDSSGNATVQILGTANQTTVLQTSTNLIDWTSVATNSLADGTWNFTDTDGPKPQQYYRVIPAP
jgi:hypothetical protein